MLKIMVVGDVAQRVLHLVHACFELSELPPQERHRLDVRGGVTADELVEVARQGAYVRSRCRDLLGRGGEPPVHVREARVEHPPNGPEQGTTQPARSAH
jgi:hypothetical protein